MKLLSIDPGPVMSAFVILDGDTYRPLQFDKLENAALRKLIRNETFDSEKDRAAIEMVVSYGKAVSVSIFDTVFWIGRYFECAFRRGLKPERLPRRDVKLYLTGRLNTRDSDIKNVLIERFATHDRKTGKGTKSKPDWFYGFKADVWAAYAVGVAWLDEYNRQKTKGADQ
jgi:hypothetical protein